MYLVVKLVVSMDLTLVVRWVDWKVASMATTSVDRMDACLAVRWAD